MSTYGVRHIEGILKPAFRMHAPSLPPPLLMTSIHVIVLCKTIHVARRLDPDTVRPASAAARACSCSVFIELSRRSLLIREARTCDLTMDQSCMNCMIWIMSNDVIDHITHDQRAGALTRACAVIPSDTKIRRTKTGSGDSCNAIHSA